MDSQASVASSVRDRLPETCFLNIDDDDEGTLDLITEIDQSYFTDIADSRSSTNNKESDSSNEDERECVELSWSDADNSYFKTLENFETRGCGCKNLYGKPCCEVIGIDSIKATRLSTEELSREELDLIVLGHINLGRDTSCQTKQTQSHRDEKEKKRSFMKYFLSGREICKATYMFAYGLGEKRLKRLFKHFDEYGMMPRRHGNKGKIPHNATTTMSDEHVVTFIRTYADINGLPLPGRMPKMKDYTVMMLPSDRSKSSIWREYVKRCTEAGINAVGRSKFHSLWKKYLPDIAVMKVSSDLCDTCQNNNSMIMKSANLNESSKSDRLRQQEQHLQQASDCRKYYKQQCEAAGEYWRSLSDSEKKGDLDGPVHISFDYAQNLSYPYSPQQVGPMYFKTPRKCAIFGVCTEHTPRQVNYLIDEADVTGKGANETISYLHHYLLCHINKIKSLQFHCDNCSGQNKNNYLMQYMCWRILTGQNENIEISFMLAYHTRFGPDWCFGLVKLKYRRSYVSSMEQLAEVVQSSTTKNINQAQMIRDLSTKDIVVKSYNWKTFFSSLFHSIPNISKYHHFRFTRERLGYVYLREFPSSPEICVKMIKDNKIIPQEDSVPLIIQPPGLPLQRAWYLYDNLRRHCDELFVDKSFPKPDKPRPAKAHVQDKTVTTEPSSSSKETNRKNKKQKLSRC